MNNLSDWLNRPYDPPGVRGGVSRAVNIDAFQFAHILSKYLDSPVNAPSLASGATAMNVRSIFGQEPTVALPSAISASNSAEIGRRVASACGTGRSSPALYNSMYLSSCKLVTTAEPKHHSAPNQHSTRHA